MFRSQRKMMRTTRNSQWRHQQQQKPYQNQGGFLQRNWKHHSTTIKTRKMMELEKIMFYDEFAELQLKVVSNPLILKTILSHMNFSDLTKTRLVCKDWKKLANLELGRRKCSKIGIWGFNSCFEMVRESDDMSWMEFDCQNLNEENLQKFTSACGHQVKMMKIYPCQTLWDLLGAGKFPNLEILKFHRFEMFSTDPTLDWTSIPDSDAIMWALRNLQKIEGVRLSHAPLVPTQIFRWKSHLIKCVKLDDWFHISSNLNQMTVLAQAKPKLERLVIGRFQVAPFQPASEHSEFIKQIYLFLESSRESLCFLKISFSNFQFKLPQSQPFPRLSTLHLYIDTEGEGEMSQLVEFLGNCRQNSLPNLKTVKIDFNYWSADFRDSLSFSPADIREISKRPLSSVVNFQIGCKYFNNCNYLLPSKWFPWLSTLFPNVQHVTVGCWKDTNQVLFHVFTHWPKLTSLTIQKSHQDVDEDVDPEFPLDPVLTGFSLEKCEELRKMDPQNMKMSMMTEELLNCRTSPNLLSLKGLKRLDIFVVGRISRPFSCPVSLVSFICAINLKPELKATIHFPKRKSGFREFLEPLVPYARLEGNAKHVY